MANARTIWAMTVTQQQQQQKPIVSDYNSKNKYTWIHTDTKKK